MLGLKDASLPRVNLSVLRTAPAHFLGLRLPVHAFEVDFHRVTSQKTEKGERGRDVATPGVFLQEGPGASGKD